MLSIAFDGLIAALAARQVIPYLGPEMLSQVPGSRLPATASALADRLSAKVAVPFKIRRNLSAAAQYIENFKHRKTLTGLMNEAFSGKATPSPLHRYLAGLELPLLVDTWYDSTMASALSFGSAAQWGMVQGVSRAEHRDQWVKWYAPDGSVSDRKAAQAWKTLLYQPIGAVSPGGNYIVSDSDYVEVLTEIDIQSPIPKRVQELREGRSFLFLGCRFSGQLSRSYARQIMKRSGPGPHWAVLPGELTRNEERFLAEQDIQRLDMDLNALYAALSAPQPFAA